MSATIPSITSCSRSQPTVPLPTITPPHVVLISIDTCRADHLGCYGHKSAHTPNLDALADEGVLFEHVIGPAPITLPSHSTMLTGTIPPYHRVRDNANSGQFEEAVEAAHSALKLLTSSDQNAFKQESLQRIQVYQQGKAFRQNTH